MGFHMSKRSKTVQKDLDTLLSAIPDRACKKEVWTLQEDAALLKYHETKGVPAIAQAMGKSKNAAYNRLRVLRAGLKNGK